VLAAALAFVCTGPPALAAPPTFQELEESLTCQCGCGLTVHSCNHLNCGSALPLRAEIREQMSQGKSKDAILAHFVDHYGEKILSSPTTTGFNLTAWVTPFVLLALGGVFVGATLVRWRKHAAARPAVGHPAPTTSPASREYDEILERELKDFDT
jgi:cytochrome c-type biogenesis protein CcmH